MAKSIEYGIQIKGNLWWKDKEVWFTTYTYSSKESAEKIMRRMKDGNPKEEYRLVQREVTEWKAVK